jgi:hypothetical protein
VNARRTWTVRRNASDLNPFLTSAADQTFLRCSRAVDRSPEERPALVVVTSTTIYRTVSGDMSRAMSASEQVASARATSRFGSSTPISSW